MLVSEIRRETQHLRDEDRVLLHQPAAQMAHTQIKATADRES